MNRDETRALWDNQAATFDDAPDHGLRDPETRQAWATLLDDVLGNAEGRVVDLGCGTGSVSLLLAERGHSVLGVDLSPKMIELAQAKAPTGVAVEFVVGDVETLPVPPEPCGAVISRHVLWAVSDVDATVARWSAPLTADGVFVAVEGVWNQAGIAPETAFVTLQSHFEQVEYTDLGARSLLWGSDVSDIRYVMVGRRRRSHTK